MNDPQALPTFGRYRLRYRVASGGMAAVYLAQLATEAGFSKWVAVKVIHAHIADDRRFIELFLDEGRLAAKLDHPNICTVFDFGQAEDGTSYLAMEYLHGESLERVARRVAKSGGVAPRIAARIVCDAARGLHHAHELRMDDGRPANVVHRDVSPQNIFVLYSGSAKVVDFGIARSAQRAADKTKTGELKGKLAYMSPEQVGAPHLVDRRTDVWALGVVLWEATIGLRLFRRDNPAATVAAISQPVPRPRDIVRGYPEALERIVLKALAHDLSARYATAAEMARDLERFIASSGEPCSAEDVASYVSALFASEKLERERMLASDASAQAAPQIVEIPSETDLPMLEGSATISSSAIQPPSLAQPPGATEPVRRPRRWIIPLVIVLSLVAGFIGARQLAYLSMEEPAAPQTLPSESAPPVIAPVAVNETQPEEHATSTVDAGAAIDAGATAEASDTPHTRQRSPHRSPRRPRTRPPRRGGGPELPASGFGFVQLSTTPSGLAVYRGSRLLGRTPLQARLPSGSHNLRIVDANGDSHRVAVVIEPYATSVISMSVH